MTLGQCLAILRARWLGALLVFAITVAVSLTVSLMLPKQYHATASVVVDFKPDPVTAMVYGGMPPPALMGDRKSVV